MAIIYLDGFEAYNTGGPSPELATLADSFTPQSTTNTFQNYISVSQAGYNLPGSSAGSCIVSASTSNLNNAMYYQVNNLLDVCIGFHAKVDANNCHLMSLDNSNARSTCRTALAIQSSGIPSLYNFTNATGTQIGTHYTNETTPISFNTWYYFELRVQVLGRAINAWAYKNGQLMANINNINTLSATTAFQNINEVIIGVTTNGITSSSTVSYDNFYVSDGQVLGPIFIAPVTPAGDTVDKDWASTSTTNTNYTEINENTGGSLNSYVISETSGDKDYYQVANIPANSGAYNILGVRSSVQYSGDMYGTSQFKVKLNTGLSEIDLDTVNVPTSSYQVDTRLKRSSLLVTNPDTSLAFTLDDIKNSKIGLERT